MPWSEPRSATRCNRGEDLERQHVGPRVAVPRGRTRRPRCPPTPPPTPAPRRRRRRPRARRRRPARRRSPGSASASAPAPRAVAKLGRGVGRGRRVGNERGRRREGWRRGRLRKMRRGTGRRGGDISPSTWRAARGAPGRGRPPCWWLSLVWSGLVWWWGGSVWVRARASPEVRGLFVCSGLVWWCWAILGHVGP